MLSPRKRLTERGTKIISGVTSPTVVGGVGEGPSPTVESRLVEVKKKQRSISPRKRKEKEHQRKAKRASVF